MSAPPPGRRGPLALAAAVVRRFADHQGFVLAGALSFSALLCLAPLTLLIFSAAGFVLKSEEITEYVMGSAIHLFPGYGDKVVQTLELLTRERQITGLVGAGGLMAFASQLFSLIRTVTNTAFEVPRRRGLVHGLVVDMLFVVVLAVLVVVLSAAMLLVLMLEHLGRALLPWLPAAGVARLAGVSLMYAVMVAVLFLVYRRAPNTTVPVPAALATTIVVVALWEGARWALTLYLARFGSYGKLYGSFGVAVATLVWLYYSAVIFTLGAELAALLSAREHRPAADDRRGDLRRLPAEHRPRDLGGHWYALAGLAGAGAAALALRTTRPATLHVFLWSIDALSVAMVALAGVATAALANTIAGFVARRRLRAEVRALEEHIRTLQIPPGSPVRQDGREVGPPE